MANRPRALYGSIALLGLVGIAYLVSWALYWPAFGPLQGIHYPLHYNDSYVWTMAWTLHQAAPGVPDPAPLTLHPGDSVHQSFLAAADHLAALRVWLAGAYGGEVAEIALVDTADPALRYAGSVRLDQGGEGRYYNLRLPPIARAGGREFQLDLQAIEGTVMVRVGYVDPLPGRLYLNEFPSPGDLDLNVYHHGPPGLWTLRVIGQRLLPQTLRARLRQYKPAAFKGPAFALLCVVLAVGVGVLLWALSPPLPPLRPPRKAHGVEEERPAHGEEEESPAHGGEEEQSPAHGGEEEHPAHGGEEKGPAREGRRVFSLPHGFYGGGLGRGALALLALILSTLIAFRWRPAGMLLLGPKVTLGPGSPTEAASIPSAQGPAVRDLVARLAFVSREPQPHQVHARVERLDGEQRACIAVPAPSQVAYGMRVPRDGELHLGIALPEGADRSIAFVVQVQGHTLLERVLDPAQAGTWHDLVLDLRPYGGASPAGGALAQITLSARAADLPPAMAATFEGEPAGAALPVAALWAAPQVTSARSWLLPEPLPEPPAYPLAVTFGGQRDAPEIELLGADVQVLPDQGTHGAVQVTLYWRALRRLYTPYTVFVHLLDGTGEIHGQWDSEPLGGTYPTDVWPAESIDGRRIIRDVYLVPADGTLPPDAQLALGLYDVMTRTRMAAFGKDGERLDDDRVLLRLCDGRRTMDDE